MRTTFRRQVTLIVSLLLAATILLGVSFWGLFTHHVIRERESSLRGTAQSVVWLMQTSAVSDDVTTSWDFLRTLSVSSPLPSFRFRTFVYDCERWKKRGGEVCARKAGFIRKSRKQGVPCRSIDTP